MPSRYTRRNLRRRAGGGYVDAGYSDEDEEDDEEGAANDIDAAFDAFIRPDGYEIIDFTMEEGETNGEEHSPRMLARSQTIRWMEPLPNHEDQSHPVTAIAQEDMRSHPVTATSQEDVRSHEGSARNSGGEGDPDCECIICCQSFAASGEHRAATLKCGHIFGKACIEQWIRQERSKALCPFCKKKTRLAEVVPLFVKSLKVVDSAELEDLRAANAELTATNEHLMEHNAELNAANQEMQERCEHHQAAEKEKEVLADRYRQQITLLQGKLRDSNDRAIQLAEERDQLAIEKQRLERELEKSRTDTAHKSVMASRYLKQVGKLQELLRRQSSGAASSSTIATGEGEEEGEGGGLRHSNCCSAS